MPPSRISIYFCNQPSGHGIPSRSRFFEKVIGLGSRENIHFAPKKFTRKSRARTTSKPNQASLWAVCGAPMRIIFFLFGNLPTILQLCLLRRSLAMGPSIFRFFMGILSGISGNCILPLFH